jgi:alkanesulfonate monooxygenase SsuD/methylene tetrahydromethanopterin reductase-like flavin-dependent oxidoreductase (luciferase family)
MQRSYRRKSAQRNPRSPHGKQPVEAAPQARAIGGTPDTVLARMLRPKEASGADELMVLAITGDFGSGRSYESLAQAFDLG